MITSKYYTCEYCYREYIPKRRGVQKYCSNSCRSNACRVRKASRAIPTIQESENLKPSTIDQTIQKQQMSLAGIGNATAGVLLADGIKSLLTSQDKKPATKGDLKLLLEKLNSRYLLIQNLPKNHLGQHPYFDLMDNILVYL